MSHRAAQMSAAVAPFYVLIFAVQFSFASSPNTNVSFRSSRIFGAGPSPGHVISVDLNGDRKLDAVLLNGGESGGASGQVGVLIGNGDGTFQAPVEYPAGVDPRAIQVADFNGDGKPDIAVLDFGTSAMSIAILLGNGDGTLQTAVMTDLTLPPAGGTLQLVAADFDGNGRADVAVILPQPQTNITVVAVLLGNGDGTFQAAKTYDTAAFDSILAIGDFNGDGKPDLLTERSDASIGVLLGNGDGTFQSPIVSQGMPGPCSFCQVLLADFNLDGKLDAIIGADLLVGNGDGTFQSPTAWNNSSLVATATGDFNADGIPDLVTIPDSFNGDGAAVFLGKGDGSFAQSASFPQASNAIYSAIGDFNGDGKQDILVLDGVLSSILGNGDGTFQVSTQLSVPNSCCPSIQAAADINRDGNPDLIFLLPSLFDSVGVELGKGDGTFQTEVVSSTNTSSLSSLRVADFNGDGKLDVAAGGNGGDFILLGKGDGSFQAPAPFGIGAKAQAVADFNNDGKLDIAGVSVNFPIVGVNITFGNGDGTFGFPNFIAENTTSNLATSAIETADFNGDGNADFAMVWGFDNASVTGKIAIFLGDGKGSFTEQDITVGSYITGLAVGDFNGDGIPDVSVTSSSKFDTGLSKSPLDDTVAVLLGMGNGQFQPPVYYKVGFLPNGIAVKDLNGDGIQDIVTSNDPLQGFFGTVSILLGKGDGTFQKAISYDGGEEGTVAIADFNGDGLPDLIMGSAVLFNTTAGVVKQAFAMLSSSSVNLGTQPVSSSGSSSVTITNTGTAKLNVASITIGGADPTQFSQTSNCATVAINASCTISVKFSPTGAGRMAATLSIGDNALNSPQVINLSGVGSDFAVSSASANLTVKAGTSGSLTLTVNPLSGFNQAVTFSCSGLPAKSTCDFSPNSVTPNGSAVSTTMTIDTTGPAAAAALTTPLRYVAALGTCTIALCFLPFGFVQPRRRTLRVFLTLIGLLGIAACGGSSGSSITTPSNPGTPTGTYTVTVSAVSGAGNSANSHTTNLTLVIN